jgi:Transposase IS116/IS110/IS902 family
VVQDILDIGPDPGGERPAGEHLMTVPAIGPIISSAMVAAIGTATCSPRAARSPAWLGLAPGRSRPEAAPSSTADRRSSKSTYNPTFAKVLGRRRGAGRGRGPAGRSAAAGPGTSCHRGRHGNGRWIRPALRARPRRCRRCDDDRAGGIPHHKLKEIKTSPTAPHSRTRSRARTQRSFALGCIPGRCGIWSSARSPWTTQSPSRGFSVPPALLRPFPF